VVFFPNYPRSLSIQYSSIHMGLFLFTLLFIIILGIIKGRRYIVGLWKAYLKLRKEGIERKSAGKRRISADTIGMPRSSSETKEDEQKSLLKTSISRPELRSITVSEEILGLFSFKSDLTRIRVARDCCL
jgi:hypothetical protein